MKRFTTRPLRARRELLLLAGECRRPRLTGGPACAKVPYRVPNGDNASRTARRADGCTIKGTQHRGARRSLPWQTIPADAQVDSAARKTRTTLSSSAESIASGIAASHAARTMLPPITWPRVARSSQDAGRLEMSVALARTFTASRDGDVALTLPDALTSTPGG